MQSRRQEEAQLLPVAIARLRASVMALTFGLVGGTAMFLATAWLLLRGGDPVGPHLALLNNYFPGYAVSWPGSVLGFVYGSIVGAATGWSMAWFYNRIADLRS